MRIVKHIVIAIVIFTLTFFLAFEIQPKTEYDYTTYYEEQYRVYVTKTGECYHYYSCHYLYSRIPIGLDEAEAKGYRPCTYCEGKSDGVIDVEKRIRTERDITDNVRTDSLIAAAITTFAYCAIVGIVIAWKEMPDDDNKDNNENIE